MAPPEELLVLGAGVSGLTCALALLSAGVRCRVWSRDLPSATTSRVAGALWYPYRVGPPAAVQRWAPIAHDMFERLGQTLDPSIHGVRMRETLELFPGEPVPAQWRAHLRGFRAAAPEELGPAHQSGWVYQTPVIDTRLYLPFLCAAIQAHGTQIEQRECEDLDEALAVSGTVVNTTGMGSRELCNDIGLRAVRGQLIRVERSPTMTRAILDEHRRGAVRYLVPVEDGCILGGSVEDGLESLEPNLELSGEIRRDCEQLVSPRDLGAHIETRVGVRPCRDAVRLEVEQRRAGCVVHNYGHGGAGVTLSWGCAAEVLGLLDLKLSPEPWGTR